MSDSHLIEQNLYFELNDFQGKEISDKEFQVFVDNVITSRFNDELTIIDGTNKEQKNVKFITFCVKDTAANKLKLSEIITVYDRQLQGEKVLQVSNKDDLQVGFGIGKDLIDNDFNPELIQVDLFFGRDIAGGGEVSDRQFQLFVDNIITPRFPDGLTIFDTKSQFQDSNGTIVREASQVVSLIIEDTQKNETEIDEIVKKYSDRFQQASILQEVNEDIAVSFGEGENLIDNDLKPELIQVGLFFGRDIAGVGEVSDRQFQLFVDNIITPRFSNGLTIFDTKGQFQNSTGRIVKERSQVVNLIIEDTDTNETAINEIVKRYTEQFKQESVLIVVDENIQTQSENVCFSYTTYLIIFLLIFKSIVTNKI